VERIARHLRPGTLAQLGLLEVLRDTIKKFAAQTGVAIRLVGVELTMRLAPGTELALLRIVQESLENVRQHARARHVTVTLRERPTAVELCIKDDGIGFDATPRRGRSRSEGGLGLLGMLERASYVGASFEVTSRRRAGTQITMRIPVGPEAAVKE
jgi:signal transduction histidine kinase